MVGDSMGLDQLTNQGHVSREEKRPEHGSLWHSANTLIHGGQIADESHELLPTRKIGTQPAGCCTINAELRLECAKMTSSTKPEVHNLLQCRQRMTEPDTSATYDIDGHQQLQGNVVSVA